MQDAMLAILYFTDLLTTVYFVSKLSNKHILLLVHAESSKASVHVYCFNILLQLVRDATAVSDRR